MAQTITTTIIQDDEPRGARKYNYKGHSCQLYIIPKTDRDAVLKNAAYDTDMGTTQCLYLLMGSEKLYIGKTDQFKTRIGNHDSQHSWWEVAYVFVDTQKYSNISLVEQMAIVQAKQNNQLELFLENVQTPKLSNITTEEQIDSENFYKDVLFLSKFVDCDVFIPSKVSNKLEDWPLRCFGSGAKAYGIYDEANKIFTIKKGSIVRTGCAEKYKDTLDRQKWVDENCETNAQGEYVLKKTVTFKSPSQASSYVLGRSSNGWEDWKTEDGTKLSSINE